MWDSMSNSSDYYDDMDNDQSWIDNLDDIFDGLRLCEICEDQYTTGDICASCQRQRSIDNGEGMEGF